MSGRFWLAVASREHVQRGRAGSFMQVNHGARGPLARIKPGDGIVYYAPSLRFGEKDGFQSLVAIGTVKPGEPHAFDMGNGFVPFRRDVDWFEAQETPIRLLLDQLDLTAGKKNWGYALRFGIIALSDRDFETMRQAMCAGVSPQ